MTDHTKHHAGHHHSEPHVHAQPWRHDHVFNQDKKRKGETRTIIVVVLTAIMMVIEIAFGSITGSIALIADGLHMASHAVALSITFFAYVIARRLAHDRRYSFGTGKINALAAFASATMLGGFSLAMASQSVWRLIFPIEVDYDVALIVAVGGFIVNGISVFILGIHHDHDDDHSHGHSHSPADAEHHEHHDHNLRAAYLHVLADTLTSLLAIVALLGIKYYGLTRLDPIMGIIGSMVVAWWAVGLLKDSARVLLDRQDDQMIKSLKAHVGAGNGDQVTDVHLWEIGPGIRAAEITILSPAPQSPDAYKQLIPAHMNIVHASVEVHHTKTSD